MIRFTHQFNSGNKIVTQPTPGRGERYVSHYFPFIRGRLKFSPSSFHAFEKASFIPNKIKTVPATRSNALIVRGCRKNRPNGTDAVIIVISIKSVTLLI
ncbi:hypothetical protein, partial [Acidocella aminolytica]